MNDELGIMDLVIVGFIAFLVLTPLVLGFFEWFWKKVYRIKRYER